MAEAPWANCYPPVEKSFVWEPIGNFLPVILLVILSSIAFVAIFFRKHKHSLFDKAILIYLVVSIWIHFGLEQYYALYCSSGRILDKTNNYVIARMWRHYGVSDTRWHGQQPGVPRSAFSCIFGLEVLAAYLCGPTAVLTVLLALFNNPWRWVIQAVSVTAQAYGLLITWIPAYYENLKSVPSDPKLFYGYFWGMQMPWLVIPIIAVIQAGYHVNKKFKQAAKAHHE